MTEVNEHYLDNPYIDVSEDQGQDSTVRFFALLIIAAILTAILYGEHLYLQPPAAPHVTIKPVVFQWREKACAEDPKPNVPIRSNGVEAEGRFRPQ